MLARKRRFLVGSLSSLVWPAVTLLFPLGITFAAARVYAESAAAPKSCDAAAVVECADAALNSVCHSCVTGSCACASAFCSNGPQGTSPNGNTCVPVPKCDDYRSEPQCEDKAEGTFCQASGAEGKCGGGTSSACLPNDGGPAIIKNILGCIPVTSSSSSGDNGGSTSGTYIPGPPNVPGSSSSSTSGGGSDDSGCTTSPGTTLPLFAAPLAIGLLFALRRKKKR